MTITVSSDKPRSGAVTSLCQATGRLDTENFLRSGSTEGIASRADPELLKDRRDGAQLIIDNRGRNADATFVCDINAAFSRSASIVRASDLHR